MKNILLVYASMTGNTEVIAEIIEEAIKEEGIEITVRESLRANPKEMLKYDGIILGSYTYEGGVIADEFMIFYEEMDAYDLTGKTAAVFGSGDSFYEKTFCAAVDLISEKLTDIGANVVLDGLKIDLMPEDGEEERCRQFGKDFAKIMLETTNR
ncbi:flavodoxin [Heyndrickxia sporothermodurans]|uniref:flavodoxin n=1 Tax=Heyndrickxia TaxID=2837504 RepID=UPI000D3D84F5|nr:flavodoxin [Heyndrickxia sporothermodurans]MEB6551425.1 flavodoxin [Heyndrickxia sporothermodurans]PTY78964.1 flavodoxin [Heyndrickxia sporothermodurans]